jgi:hypothetical protein
MSGRVTSKAGFSLLAACLASAGSCAQAQVQVQVLPGGGMVGDMVGRLPFQPAGVEGDAIGDPWWDDAAAKPEADTLTAEPADDGEEDAAAPQGQLEIQLRAQAEMMRNAVRQAALRVLRRDLSMVRQSCPTLEPQQRASVLQAGREAVEKAADDQGAAILARRRVRQPETEAVSEAVRAAVAATAAAEEAAAYEAELGLRKERVKQATIAALVADVDRDAFLDDAEREALAEALAESYRESWRQAVLAWQQGRGLAGTPPATGVERCVRKALGADREAEWLTLRKEAVERLAGGGGGVGQVNWRADGNGVQVQFQVQVQVQGGGEAEAAAGEEEP